MEIKTIKINKDKLKNTIKLALRHALDFNWSGWRLPIFANDDGELEIGSWMSQGSWQPGANELYSIEPWEIDEWYDSQGLVPNKEELSEDDIEENIVENVDDLIDFHIEGVEDKIDQHNTTIQMRIDEMNYGKELGYNIPDITFVQYELIDE
jgi:hypothetical protein